MKDRPVFQMRLDGDTDRQLEILRLYFGKTKTDVVKMAICKLGKEMAERIGGNHEC